MNIYFSGSIKGGRQLVDRYRVMIKTLSQYGTVLTEHIGDTNYANASSVTPQMVYAQDKDYLDNSDIVIADITVPSLGVGYELAYAEAHRIPTICLYDAKAGNVSYMILGNDYYKSYPYVDDNDAVKTINNIMQQYTQGDKDNAKIIF